MTQDELLALLYRHQDEKYADFSAKLIPTVPRERFIGVRSPEYPKILRELGDDPVIPVFLEALPHRFHEENCLHAALLNGVRDFDECLAAVERFLPFIDNWAVNDSLNPACFAKNHAALLPRVRGWIASGAPYTRRFGLHILMSHFLKEDFRPEYLDQPADLRSEEYYVNMMTAWLFAEALVKQWDAALPYIETRRLDPWTHNKAIQKACESFRLTEEQKAHLKALKRKPEKRPKPEVRSGERKPRPALP